jgi:hypothetical protein
MMCFLVFTHFGGKGELQKYFSNAATKVKATDDPSEKRAILTNSFQTMSKALDMVQQSPSISKEDGMRIELVKATLQEKQDELAGMNGYAGVSDAQLNAFSAYVVQDMEQADQMITISLVTLLLIIILMYSCIGAPCNYSRGDMRDPRSRTRGIRTRNLW